GVPARTRNSTDSVPNQGNDVSPAGERTADLLPPTRRRVLRDPREYFLMPALAVGRLQDPVPLVRELDEPRRHPLPLQRREQLDPLADRAAEVEVVTDDQHRRLELAEVGRVAVRRVLLIALPV